MYVFRNADEIKDTLEPAFCYWAARSRIYTGVGYKIPSIDSFHDEFTCEGGEGDGLRDSFHRYGDFSFYLCKLLGFNKRITFCCVALTQKRRLNSLAEKSALREIVDSRLMKLRRMIMRFSIIVVEHDRWFNRRRIDNFPLPTSCTIITSCSTNFRTLDNFERESISLC